MSKFKSNPYIKQIDENFPYYGIYFYHPTRGEYHWTGSSMKPGYNPSKVKVLTIEEAEKEFIVAKEYIKTTLFGGVGWMEDFNKYIIEEKQENNKNE